LDVGKKWLSESSLKAELPDGEELVKDERDSPRLENEELCFWSSEMMMAMTTRTKTHFSCKKR